MNNRPPPLEIRQNLLRIQLHLIDSITIASGLAKCDARVTGNYVFLRRIVNRGGRARGENRKTDATTDRIARARDRVSAR